MNTEGVRHRKRGRIYDVLFVPIERMEATRRFRFSLLRICLVVGGLFFLIVALTLVILIYTPLALYVKIPNPELEKRYGREFVETQRRLKALADDVLLLRDYNLQLRKAMGAERADASSSSQISAARVPALSGLVGAVETSEPGEKDPVPLFDDVAGDDPGASQFNAVVTNAEGFRAAFPLLPPTEGFVTQGFDPSRKHFGIDFAGKRGSAVYAASDGYVLFAGWTYDDGNMVIVSHGGGYVTVYKHNQILMKNVSSFVRRGEVIALLGNSGRTSTGPHLHFEVWKDGMPQDPNEFLLIPAKVQ